MYKNFILVALLIALRASMAQADGIPSQHVELLKVQQQLKKDPNNSNLRKQLLQVADNGNSLLAIGYAPIPKKGPKSIRNKMAIRAANLDAKRWLGILRTLQRDNKANINKISMTVISWDKGGHFFKDYVIVIRGMRKVPLPQEELNNLLK